MGPRIQLLTRGREKLFKQANMPKELYFIEGADHNNIQHHNPQDYWPTIAEWLEDLENRKNTTEDSKNAVNHQHDNVKNIEI